MLSELTITDFAIIDRLQLNFAAGFVVFTGETGAGKSIIIDAVDLLLGGRAEATMVRAGADVARVEAVFQLDEGLRPTVEAILDREALTTRPLTRQTLRPSKTSARPWPSWCATSMACEKN